jgi:lysophospholipid acyltransferase (LPLAT)-like uncharacterized protein
MRTFDKVLRNGRVRRILCWLAALYIRFAYTSGRWTRIGADIPNRLWDEGRPFILCFWHGRMLMLARSWRRGAPVHMLISSHRDGQLIADTISRLGIQAVAGSTRHGGSDALRAMLRILKAGESIGITPDGPHGPRMRAGNGVTTLARLSGTAIVPATYSITRRHVMNSWDRFIVPWPFGRGVIIWGEPINVPRDADDQAMEAARQQVEDALNALTAEADRQCGRTPVEPDPVAGSTST